MFADVSASNVISLLPLTAQSFGQEASRAWRQPGTLRGAMQGHGHARDVRLLHALREAVASKA